jgi:glutamyl-tRNA synthetase
VRTRLAPSPTGALHVGNARTFLLNWVHARAAGGVVLYRNDDLDGPRVKQAAAEQARADLLWLGLDWDEAEGILVQSERAAVYAAAAERLVAGGLAYPCVCTRSEIEDAASAPHGADGARYPGTCDGRFVSLEDARRQTGRSAALRFRTKPGPVTFEDLLRGRQAFDPSLETGDFPIQKANGTAAYQLATVIDDAETGIDLVVRGDDLLPSTARQILLQRALGLPTPAHLHLPLVLGPDGRRLAKRHGDTRIATLRAGGLTPDALIGWLAWSAGLAQHGERLTARDLISRYQPGTLPTTPIVLSKGDLPSVEPGV